MIYQPSMTHSYHENLFSGDDTIYFDLIEIYDLYPKFEINQKVHNE